MISAARLKWIWVAAALLLAGFSSSVMGAVRFDVVGSPTEVINTGRSEVLGSISLIVHDAGSVTGTSAGGASQIAILLSNPPVQIDNTQSTGIKLIYSPGFAAAGPSVLSVDNILVNGQCAGLITLNLPGGVPLSQSDFIRLEGVRGRIDASVAITPGTDIYADLQSVNDPAANVFSPDSLRLAKSLKAMNIDIVATALSYEIRITEGFGRAFVDADAGNDAATSNDRTDSDGAALGAPTNSTQFFIRITGIPSAVADVTWPAQSSTAETGAALYLLGSSFSESVATATYSYEAVNQPNASDTAVESFSVRPQLVFREGGSCRLEGFATSVRLAPGVEAAAGCAAPAAAARPRFLEAYELAVTGLQPVSAIAGGTGFTLTVNGTGFVPGSTVLWNGQPRATTIVDSTTLTAAITTEDIARVGTARVSIANPATGGGAASQAREFPILAPALSLYYPRLVATDAALTEATEYTGIALANISGRVATVKLTAFDRTGSQITGPDITNPATLTLKGGRQLPLIDSQIFGAGLRKAGNPVGWVKVEGDVPQVVGFFLAFNEAMTRLDGADVTSATSAAFVLPEIAGEGFSNLYIANPNQDPVTVNLELVQADGSVRTAVTRTINANGVLIESVAELFAATAAASTDFVRAQASHGVVAFEYLGTQGMDIQGVNGQDRTSGATTLYSPQFLAGGTEWHASLSVVNLSSTAGTVNLKFIGDDGMQIGATRELPIAANGKVYINDPSFFVDAGDTLEQGYVVIRSDGVRLAGSVVFGNPRAASFSTALPLMSSPQSDFVFGQVASNRTFFTGIALVNPGEEQAAATVRVFDSSGQAIAANVVTVPAKGRTARLLTEYFPELKGLEISSGYITVSTLRGYLVGFALFGTHNLSVLSAVPAQLVP